MHRRKPHRLSVCPPSDHEVFALVCGGDVDAYEILIDRHQEKLMNFFVRLGVSPVDAEDLVQETFVRVYRDRQRYRPRSKFTTFLYTVGRNAWVDSVRKRARYANALASYGAELEVRSGQAAIREGGRMDAQAVMDTLPEKLRAVVVLSIYQGLKYREIAEVLNIPEGTVKSRMSLAMSRMKERLHVRQNTN